MKNDKMQIAFIGVGDISGIYLKNITEMFKEIEIIGVCDLIREKAEKAVKEYNIPKLYNDMYEAFNDSEVDIILNITRPLEHYEVTKAALLAGKHVYSEKPLSPNFEEAKELVALAEEKGLRLGGAPDTYLGAGIQTCLKLIKDGFIGKPFAAYARMINRGAEHFRDDCRFLYEPGGGPLFDMGPYYITTLMNIFGRVEAINGMCTKAMEQRRWLCGEHYGEPFDVTTPTTIMSNLKFEDGSIATLVTSFDVTHTDKYSFEVYGTEGTILVPDPNTFGGPVKILRTDFTPGAEKVFKEVPVVYNYPYNSRALGLADMAKSILSGRKHRANCYQQLHLVEVMNGIIDSSEQGKTIVTTTPYEKSAPMDTTVLQGYLEE